MRGALRALPRLQRACSRWSGGVSTVWRTRDRLTSPPVGALTTAEEQLLVVSTCTRVTPSSGEGARTAAMRRSGGARATRG